MCAYVRCYSRNVPLKCLRSFVFYSQVTYWRTFIFLIKQIKQVMCSVSLMVIDGETRTPSEV